MNIKAICNVTGEEIDLTAQAETFDNGVYMISPNGKLYDVQVVNGELYLEQINAKVTLENK